MAVTKQDLDKIKKEASYKKIVEMKVFENFFEMFSERYLKVDYPSAITNPLHMALEFYKYYNLDYYVIIVKAIQNKQIVIGENLAKSYVDTNSGKSYIRLSGDDSDLFNLVHEFSHFIDRNSSPHLIPDEYWFLAEVFSFYMEKKLELWLGNKYSELIVARKRNRLYFESKMVEAIKYQLKYEEMYLEKGSIRSEDVDPEEMQLINRYNYPNLVNYLVMYPLANVLSEYLINFYANLSDKDLYQTCLSLDLYEVMENFKDIKLAFLENKDGSGKTIIK